MTVTDSLLVLCMRACNQVTNPVFAAADDCHTSRGRRKARGEGPQQRGGRGGGGRGISEPDAGVALVALGARNHGGMSRRMGAV